MVREIKGFSGKKSGRSETWVWNLQTLAITGSTIKGSHNLAHLKALYESADI
ncbi:hypothetical protein SAMN04487996_11454 [Dyadobacter soli]|uniref:Uncharacterized protein n=1 Tax=Dyadobacter soli TaxID=659014 RepID=A0A1G7QHH7_9BACT|nr:hypothetical protein SAMN04487996_11454 [Dyadobacter soli]